MFVFEDLPASRALPVDGQARSEVAGVYVDDGDGLEVQYRHPVTRQLVQAPYYNDFFETPGSSGDRVRVIVEHDDPMVLTRPGQPVMPLATNAWAYVAVSLLAALPSLYRRWQLRKAERLAASLRPTFAMQAALFRSRFGRAYLALYPLDAVPGSEAVCVARVVTTARAPQGPFAFPIEVKGSPRPLGRVVASYREDVLWPAGPAIARRHGHLRPAGLVDTANRLEEIDDPHLSYRPQPWRLLGPPAVLVAVSVVFLIVVSLVTFRNASKSDEWFAEATETIGEVVGTSGEDTFVSVRYRRGDAVRVANAPVIYDSDFKKGTKYPIRVDRDDPAHIRLESEPYDRTGPISYAAFLALVMLPFAIRHALVWRRLRRRAARGPWYRAIATHEGVGAFDSVDLGLRAGTHLVGAVPVGHFPRAGSEPQHVVLAGALDPGNAVAVWLDGEALPPAGTVKVVNTGVDHFIEPEAEFDDGEVRLAGSVAVIELKHFAMSWRRPWIRVGPTGLTIAIPALFTEPWFLPIETVAALDTEDEEVLDGGPISVPDIPTASWMSSATLILLFREPVRVPPLRWIMAMSAGRSGLPWGCRETRSREGAWVDGLRLQVVNPAAALEALRSAGVETPPSLLEWLTEHRPNEFYRRRASWLGRFRRSFEK